MARIDDAQDAVSSDWEQCKHRGRRAVGALLVAGLVVSLRLVWTWEGGRGFGVLIRHVRQGACTLVSIIW